MEITHDVVGGNDGSPIWIDSAGLERHCPASGSIDVESATPEMGLPGGAKKCSGPCAVAIYTNEFPSNDPRRNGAVRINGPVYKNLAKWKEAAEPPDDGFFYDFTHRREGRDWKQLSGRWQVTGGALRNTKAEYGFSSVAHGDIHGDFELSVRMRESTAARGGIVFIRGVAVADNPQDMWHSGYSFTYANTHAVCGYAHRFYDRVRPLVPGGCKSFPGAIVPYDWNIIRVVAQGRRISFYINNRLAWRGNDNEFTSGRVGIGFYRPPGAGGQLEVDWIKLEELK